MVKDNQIVDFAKYLRKSYQINYRELLDTAKKLKTIDQQILREAGKYFNPDSESNDSSIDEMSSNHNIVDRVIHDIENMPGEPSYDKSKKRWWTPEED